MTRSAESLERRRTAHRAWRQSPEGRAYYAAWRKDHRATEKARKDRWRAANPDKLRAQREGENARRRAARPVVPPVPEPASGHPLFDEAVRLVPFAGRGRSVSFWLEELEYDLRAEAVLAMLEGRDPAEAVKSYRGRETNWQRHAGWAGPLLTGEFSEELAA